MRLSVFILSNLEPILQEWEDFASALGAVTKSMDAKALRDHAKQILLDIVKDLETYQSMAQQEAKAKATPQSTPSFPDDSGAGRHGDIRATEGFTLDQMVSEYRALRASVLRLWAQKVGISDATEAQQITRFNEAIDEALAESVKRYARDVERLIAAAHSKERLAALGTLSAGLGHDMSNVLMPMRVLLAELDQTDLPPASKSMLDALRRSVEHLRGLTRGLRSLSLDPENAHASTSRTDLHSWWVEATSPYKWALSPSVVLNASGLESPSLPAVALPKHVLMQAVFNLVQNASEALSAQGGGTIWVSAKEGEDATTVLLEVRDDGPGMDPLTLARCTEPFFTSKPRGRGTGLGLSLVRTALERHGGRLLIESSPDKGSLFTLVMPVAQREIPPQGPRIAILTVRDERMRAMIAALLSGVGVQVSTQHELCEAQSGHDGRAPTTGGFLWVADDSASPRAVLRFLADGGPNARVVALGTWLPADPGSQGEAATHDGHLIQIAAMPTQTSLLVALRRAIVGWTS
jgi:signal transduction histidine kinase